MEKQAKRIRDEDVRGMFLKDIYFLSVSFTPEDAEKAIALFLVKWEANENAVIKNVTAHFKLQWTNNNVSNWTRGHCPNCVVNNNGLEATNHVIKVEVTQRKLLPVLTFFAEVSRWLMNQSTRRDPTNVNFIPFTSVHTISTGDWTEAYRWHKDTAKQVRIVGNVYVALHGNVTGDLTDAKAAKFISQFTDFTFVTFDEYTSLANGICIIRPDTSREEGYNCTCKANAKQHSCIHSLGVGILRGTMAPPREARATLLGRKRTRGRKPDLPAAWDFIAVNINSPINHPQQDPILLAGGAVILDENVAQQDIQNELIE